MELRRLTITQQILLSVVNADLNKLFRREAEEVTCAIAGGYLHASREPNDVDIIVYLKEDIISEVIYDTLTNLGFTITEEVDESEYGIGNGLLCRARHDEFFGLEVQFICRDIPIKDKINYEFPLSIQQVAWLPNGVLFKGNDFIRLEGSNVILANHANSPHIEKYRRYFPDYTIVKEIPALPAPVVPRM